MEVRAERRGAFRATWIVGLAVVAFQALVAEAWRKSTGGLHLAPFWGTYVGLAFGLWGIVAVAASRSRRSADALAALAVSSASLTLALALLAF